MNQQLNQVTPVSSPQTQSLSEYGAAQIQILEGLEAVRKRPAMYIGSTSAQGLHHLIYEIVDNAVDEALAGHCTHIQVTLNPDGSVTVTDNGRGIPVGIQKKTGLSAIQVVFTVLHAGGKFDNENYKVSGGLHGVGASVVNALSHWLEVTVYQDGCSYFQRYEHGIPTGDVVCRGVCPGHLHGTEVTFLPDDTIFRETYFSYDVLKERMRETAFLTQGLTVSIRDTRRPDTPQLCFDSPQNPSDTCSFCYQEGIRDFVAYLNRDLPPLYPQIVSGTEYGDDIQVEFAFQHNTTYGERIHSFVNNISTQEGGTHLTGFRSALSRAANDYARAHNMLKEHAPSFTKEELSEGLTAVISIKLKEPQFEGQTKQKLGNRLARTAVEALAFQRITIFFEQNPAIAKAICEKALLAQHAKNAARHARELTRSRQAAAGMSLPGKLADCSERDAEKCELFIVEGDSAGGSAKMARSRLTQAILPLRGKILNVEKARLDKIYANAEIKAMIAALGTGVLDDFSAEKLRYHKIILMTDADVDGAHITTLLLTFFFRFMPELIRGGYVYLAQPPLYRVDKNKKIWYAYNDKELSDILDMIGRDGSNRIQRYKGLGEMDASQLWETTMDPGRRVLLRVTMEGCGEEASQRLFSLLMGEDVAPRRDFIFTHARFADGIDL